MVHARFNPLSNFSERDRRRAQQTAHAAVTREIELFLGQIGTRVFQEQDLAEAIFNPKFDCHAAVQVCKHLHDEGRIERTGPVADVLISHGGYKLTQEVG